VLVVEQNKWRNSLNTFHQNIENINADGHGDENGMLRQMMMIEMLYNAGSETEDVTINRFQDINVSSLHNSESLLTKYSRKIDLKKHHPLILLFLSLLPWYHG
jgi:site-specific recombinase XerD